MYSELTKHLDQYVRKQLEHYKIHSDVQPSRVRPVITLSREFGCEGLPVAGKLAERLKSLDDSEWLIYNRKIISEITDTDEFDQELMQAMSEHQRSQVSQFIEHLLAHKPNNYNLYKQMARSVKALSSKGHCIIVGAAGAILNREQENALHIRLKANEEFRIERISRLLSLDRRKTIDFIEENEESRQRMIKNFTGKNVEDSAHYDLIIDNSRFNANQIVEFIVKGLQFRIPEWQTQ